MQRARVLASLVLAAVLGAGCGSGDPATGQSCEAGEHRDCDCAAETLGLQPCNPASGAWFDCRCPSAPSNAETAVVGNLEWEKAPNPKKQHAFAFTDCRVKGWRLPSRAELKSLYSSCSDTPGPLSLFPSCTCADGDPCKMLPQDKMWTGEYAGTYSGLYPDAWVVDAQNTRESYFMAMSAEHSYLSLCVRQTRSGSGE